MTSRPDPSASLGPWRGDLLAEILERLREGWRRPDGLWAARFKRDRCIEPGPLLPDLGDVAPFVAYFGDLDVAREQFELAAPWLLRGLFSRDGRTWLFENHDFLLGLLELYEQTGDRELLDAARTGIESLRRDFEHKGLLLDQQPPRRVAGLPTASPFNAGFIEVCVDLFEATGEAAWLTRAERWAGAWVRTPFFRLHGLFARFNTPRLPIVGYLAARVSRHGPVRLFKDNTNAVWSLLALHVARPEAGLEGELGRFLDAFERRLFRDGLVRQQLGRSRPRFHQAASTFSLDLLCDLAWRGVQPERCLSLALRIAERMDDLRWPDGRLPVEEGSAGDHLDIMTDLGIALTKLAELTGEAGWAERAAQGWRATLETHRSEHGLVLSVDRQGRVADETIVVKYQALALKPAVLADRGGRIYDDTGTWKLLRDR